MTPTGKGALEAGDEVVVGEGRWDVDVHPDDATAAVAESASPALVELAGVWATMGGEERIHAVADVSLRIER
ncbi:MAG: hypothetical protein IPN02_09990 [Candidatus Microthrix sp.]|uniref:Uncharacterized protein n=1 Tax=Candidatus Neomicrothrix subdominans TaxID=2954438 RepID=A0A936TD26_9ACTN|nr:hypothetical protein [Candidatus Microthrix subdominans]